MPFDLKTATPVIEQEGKTFAKSKFDINTALPYRADEEITFKKNSEEGASLRTYTPTWKDKVSAGLEAIGLKPDARQQIAKAQVQVFEANELKDKNNITFDEALQTVLSRDRSDPIAALKVFGNVLKRTPKSVGIAVLKMHQGAEGASVVNKDWITKSIRDADENSAKFVEDVQRRHKEKKIIPFIPIKITDVGQLAENMSYSITSMGAGAATGIPIAFIPVAGARIAAWTTGTIASGKAAFEMSTYEIMQEFLEAKNEESIEKLGRGITAEEEKELKKFFNDKAREFGLWEAVPEAISNLAFVSILTAPLTKMLGTTLATRIVSKIAGLYGGELLTETVTEKGQVKIRREAGLEEGEPDITWSEAFKRIAPQTFLLTTIMAGTGTTIIKIQEKVKNSLKKEIGETHPDFEKLSDGIDKMAIKEEETFKGQGKVISTSEEFAQEIVEPVKAAPEVVTPEIAPELQPLIEKAKKFDTAEEFVESLQKERIASVEELVEQGFTKEQAEFISTKVSDMLDIKSPSLKGIIDNIDDFNRLSGDKIEIFRVVPKGKSIELGDFVFTSKKEAIEFREEFGFIRGQSEIVKRVVNSNDLIVSKTGKFGDEAIFLPKAFGTKQQLTDIFNQAKAEPVKKPTKIRGLSKGVEAKAIEKKLTEGLGPLPEFETISMVEQANKAQALVSKSPEKAKRIALGKEFPPADILPESVFIAVENRAIEEGDVELLRNLAVSSSLTAEATVMGQRIRTLAERVENSPVKAINEIAKAREETAKKRLKTKSVKKLHKKTIKKIKSEIKKASPTKETWGSFIESLEC